MFSETEDKEEEKNKEEKLEKKLNVKEQAPAATGPTMGRSKVALAWRNKISWVCCYVSSLEHAHSFGLLSSVIRLSKYIASVAHVRFKIFS